MWNTTRGVPKKVTLGGAGAPKCAPSLSLSRGTAAGGQGPFPARVSRRRELETRSLFSPATRVSGSPAPFTPHPGPAPRAPSSFSQLFRGSPWAPRPPTGDVTMVQRGGQWVVAGAGSAGQWRRRAAPRSCPAGAALRRPPLARQPPAPAPPPSDLAAAAQSAAAAGAGAGGTLLSVCPGSFACAPTRGGPASFPARSGGGDARPAAPPTPKVSPPSSAGSACSRRPPHPPQTHAHAGAALAAPATGPQTLWPRPATRDPRPPGVRPCRQ